MMTYSIVLNNGQEVVRQLIKQAGVRAEEIKNQPVDICFVDPMTINILAFKAPIAIVLVREGTHLNDRQIQQLYWAVKTNKAQVVFDIDEKDAVQRLKAWFPPKTLSPCTGVAI